MIIAVSGSVGVGKTSVSQYLAEQFDAEYFSLNDYAQNYKLEEVPQIQTFDFDIDSLLKDVEKQLREYRDNNKSIIVESHFAHLINPELVDIVIIINRDLGALKQEYKQRGYNEQKIKDNLEVESFDLCFFEAEEEGYSPNQFIKIENDEDIEELQRRLVKKIKKRMEK